MTATVLPRLPSALSVGSHACHLKARERHAASHKATVGENRSLPGASRYLEGRPDAPKRSPARDVGSPVRSRQRSLYREPVFCSAFLPWGSALERAAVAMALSRRLAAPATMLRRWRLIWLGAIGRAQRSSDQKRTGVIGFIREKSGACLLSSGLHLMALARSSNVEQFRVTFHGGIA